MASLSNLCRGNPQWPVFFSAHECVDWKPGAPTKMAPSIGKVWKVRRCIYIYIWIWRFSSGSPNKNYDNSGGQLLLGGGPPPTQSVYILLLYRILNSLLKNSDVVFVTSWMLLGTPLEPLKHDQLLIGVPKLAPMVPHRRGFLSETSGWGAVFGDGIVGVADTRVAPISES